MLASKGKGGFGISSLEDFNLALLQKGDGDM